MKRGAVVFGVMWHWKVGASTDIAAVAPSTTACDDANVHAQSLMSPRLLVTEQKNVSGVCAGSAAAACAFSARTRSYHASWSVFAKSRMLTYCVAPDSCSSAASG